MAIVLAQAYQLARARLASAASPIVRLLVQRDQEATEGDLLRRELEVFRAQRESLPPHRRPDYSPAQRLAILQLRRLRGWSIRKTAERFVVHRNTIRGWIRAAEGKGRPSLLAGAVVWNRIDEAVRWAATTFYENRQCVKTESSQWLPARKRFILLSAAHCLDKPGRSEHGIGSRGGIFSGCRVTPVPNSRAQMVV
jgi:transposase-like protein